MAGVLGGAHCHLLEVNVDSVIAALGDNMTESLLFFKLDSTLSSTDCFHGKSVMIVLRAHLHLTDRE